MSKRSPRPSRVSKNKLFELESLTHRPDSLSLASPTPASSASSSLSSLAPSLGAAPSQRRARPYSTENSVGRLQRSANPGLRAAVFGATGQVGRGVVSLLAASGVQCIIPYRGDE